MWFLGFVYIFLSIPKCLFAATLPTQRDKLFYVYEWSDNITNSWPQSVPENKRDFSMSFYANFGTGPVVNQSTGLHKTFQYGLFRIFYHKLLTHKRRTTNPEEATSFFIPYDIGIDSTYAADGKLRATNCPRATRVSSLLIASPYFSRYNGEDHFLLHAINQPMTFFNNRPNCLAFLTDLCRNCTKLSIDTYPQGYKRGQYLPRWHAIPFPSNYHFSPQVTQEPWRTQNPLASSTSAVDGYAATGTGRRQYAVSFVGTLYSSLDKSRRLRQEMHRQCRLAGPLCVWNGLSTHNSNGAIETTGESSGSGGTGTSPVGEKSTFCLTPPGDFPTRKGFFDSLLAGCIPVVFAPLSAHTQWPWHLGLPEAFSVSVYIPARRLLVDKPFNVVEHLIDLHYNARDEIYLKQKAIEDVAFSLQYSLPSTESELIRGRADALDISLRHVLAMHTEYRECCELSSDYPSITVDSTLQKSAVSYLRYENVNSVESTCRRKVIYGDYVDRTQVPPLLSFAYNIHPSNL